MLPGNALFDLEVLPRYQQILCQGTAESDSAVRPPGFYISS